MLFDSSNIPFCMPLFKIVGLDFISSVALGYTFDEHHQRAESVERMHCGGCLGVSFLLQTLDSTMHLLHSTYFFDA